MKFCKIFVISFLFFISCDEPPQEVIKNDHIVDVQIPTIKKNRNDKGFQLKNGVLHFEKTPYSGTVIKFYDNGSLKSESTYYQGKREGKYFGFYPNKNKWFERYYTNGFKTKKHKGWHDNGQQMFEYKFNNKGVYDGAVKEWYNNGQLAKHFNFKNGQENGSQKMWKPTGKIKSNFFTVNGERYGLIGLKNCVSVAKTK